MQFTRSRKTPVEAFGVRAATRRQAGPQGQSCTCRHRRPLGGTLAAEDRSDDDGHAPHTTTDEATGRSVTGPYCAQCAVVYEELQQVDHAVREQASQPSGGSTSRASAGRPGGARAGHGRVPNSTGSVRANTQLMGAPFTDSSVAGGRGATSSTARGQTASASSSLLASMLRLQQAADWLAQCPGTTLRVLQQHTLCHLEGYLTNYLGIPPYMQTLMPGAGDTDEEPGSAVDDGPEAPLPLDLRTFFAEFLIVETATATSPSPARRLLSAGRPVPAAPVSSVDLPYGTFLAEEALAPDEAPSSRTALDAQTLADVAEWTRFFSAFFDPAKEAQCRDPLGLFCAILLACSELGRRERHARLDAVVDRAVAQQCGQDDSHAHRHTCSACRSRQAGLRGAVMWHCLTHSAASSGASRTRADVRLFLRTPVMVLWVAGFLQMGRMTFGPQQHAAGLERTVSIAQDAQDRAREEQEESGLLDTDVVPPGEAYAIRDWLLAAIESDTSGFIDQETVGALRTTTSSASNAPVRMVGFRKPELLASVGRLSAWIDDNVQRGRGLRARVVLHVLREDFPVVAYYFSFFAS